MQIMTHFFLTHIALFQRSTCSNHNAVNKDRSRKGFAATGVGAIDCTHHDMKWLLAVGDLQKGER